MFRRALAPARQLPNALRRTTPSTGSRFLSTASPANRPRTWRSAALRWGIAGAAVYWYNTSPLFAEEIAPRTIPAPPQFSDDDFKTVDAVIEEKRLRSRGQTSPTEPAPVPAASSEAASVDETTMASPGALEEEAGQEGAFNPETGEINWDCPCLGGMANGPCGEEFKTAFSCFVFSKEEPKGMDCIEKFQGMQECFRKYPEIYGAELADDEADDEAAAAAVAADPAPGASASLKDGAPADAVAKDNTKTTEAPAPSPAAGDTVPQTQAPKPDPKVESAASQAAAEPSKDS